MSLFLFLNFILFLAGDFVKFGFPMAWSMTVLAWGMIDYADAYQAAGKNKFPHSRSI